MTDGQKKLPPPGAGVAEPQRCFAPGAGEIAAPGPLESVRSSKSQNPPGAPARADLPIPTPARLRRARSSNSSASTGDPAFVARDPKGPGRSFFPGASPAPPAALAIVDETVRWLRALLLENGCQRVADLEDWAKAAGHARWAFARAVRRLGLEAEGVFGVAFWSLPGQPLYQRNGKPPPLIQFFHNAPDCGWVSTRAPP